jgi:virginiamycin B lyase
VGNRIGKLDSSGKLSEVTVPTAGSGPAGIAVARDGTVWFTELKGNAIGRIDPATGAVREFPIPTKNAQPDGIAVGPDGRVWFAEVGAGKVGILTP